MQAEGDEVAEWVAALTVTRPVVQPALLAAARPGRVRGIGTEIWARVLGRPRHAGATLRTAMREARALHSRERRLVGDLLHDLIRVAPLLDLAAGRALSPLSQWLGWLSWSGLRQEDVPDDEGRAAWVSITREAVVAALDGLSPGDALTALLGIDRRLVDFGLPGGVVGDDLIACVPDLSGFLSSTASRGPVTLRAHGVTRDELISRLRGLDLQADAGRWAPDAVVLPPGVNLHGVSLPRDAYALQDEGSQLVGSLLGVRPGERVLDACAGAGGKTLQLGRALAGQGTLWATDVRGKALGELKRRARDAGVRVRTALLREDGPSCDLGPAFDAVLVDAPCTGSGVWRRHPEHRWRLSDLPSILALQAHVLDEAFARVRPGGRLVYATCSVLDAEGGDVVAAALSRHPSLQLVPVRQAAPWLDASLVDGPFLRTWPHKHDTDGFFGACFERMP